jgi:type III secretory pathway component EscV
MVDFRMIHTAILLGIYILSVVALFVTARYRTDRLHRLHPILVVSLYSLVPALALGRQILLSTEYWTTVAPIPVWLSGGVAALVVIAIVLARPWIRSTALERPMDAAHEGLDDYPRRAMAIDEEVSRGSIKPDEGDRRKNELQRSTDRSAAIEGSGRILFTLLNIHLVRLGLQVAGTVAIGVWSEALSSPGILAVSSVLILVDGVLILGPYLLLFGVIAL